jgi:hypothetical protein
MNYLCRCAMFNYTTATPLPDTYHGGLACCHDASRCHVEEEFLQNEEALARNLRLRVRWPKTLNLIHNPKFHSLYLDWLISRRLGSHICPKLEVSLYSLIWDFLLSQIDLWTTTIWSNVWVVLPKPSSYEFLIEFLIWTPVSKYLHLTTFFNICVILSMFLYL